jgi:chromatin remodeling complex protein RSC6
MQTRSGKVYRYNVSRPTLEKVEPKVQPRVEPRVESKLDPRVEPKLNRSTSTLLTRVPSGFITPTRISDELAKFLKVPVGTQLTRVDVSKLINGYINVNKLQDSKNGRIINPDAKLRKLLRIPPTDELSYFNMQKYLKPHFIRD